MKKTFIFLCICMITGTGMKAQEGDQSENVIFQVPQYLFSHGVRVDWDKKLKGGNRWLVIAPQVYWAQNSNLHDFEELIGYGLDLYLKQVFSKQNTPTGAYFAYGLTFQNHYLNYPGEKWTTYMEDGLEYQRIKNIKINQNIFKFGPNFIMGIQFELYDRLYMDLYAGMGLRVSMFGYPDHEKFDGNLISPGYTGVLPLAGVRGGISF